ncbi:MAG: hypothetical protein V4553_18045 [Bacteroidota bacterium]
MTIDQFNKVFKVESKKSASGGFTVEVLRISDGETVFKINNNIEVSHIREMQLFLNISDDQLIDDLINSTIDTIIAYFKIKDD